MKRFPLFLGWTLAIGITSLPVLAQDDNHGDTTETATIITPDSVTPGYINRDLDFDYFRIVVMTEGILRIRTTGATDTGGGLFDSSGNALAYNDDALRAGGADLNFQIFHPVTRGSYYLLVTGYPGETGPYALLTSLNPGSAEDDHVNSEVNAAITTIPQESATNGILEYSGDLDVFRVEIRNAGILTIRTEGSTNTAGGLADAQGIILAENDDRPGDTNFEISYPVEAGTYYIGVGSYDLGETGPYRLVVDGPGDGPQRDDHGDSPESATAIAPDSATEGVIDPGGDRDFFRITVETAGFLTVRTTGDTDTVGTLFDATGTSLITNSEISKEDLNFLISYPVTAGIYYLEVRGYGESDGEFPPESGPYQLISSLQSGGPLQVGQILRGNTGEEAGFAVVLNADGTRMAVGSPGPSSSLGNVRVYELAGPRWIQLGQTLTGEVDGDGFGFYLSMSADGNRIVVGSPYNDSNGENAGLVRAYQLNGDTWVQLGRDIVGQSASEYNGISVAMSSDGTRIVIGASGGFEGQVRIYQWSGNAWQQLGGSIDGQNEGDQFGGDVAMSADGNRIAIAAPGNDEGGNRAGRIRVYQWSGNSWQQLGGNIDGAAADADTGWISLNADGSRIAVGTPRYLGGEAAGDVRIYQLSPRKSWQQLGQRIEGNGGYLSMSADGSTIVTGGNYTGAEAAAIPRTRIYRLQAGRWVQLGRDIEGPFGAGSWPRISGDGSRVAIGEWMAGEDNNGQVRVFDLSTLEPVNLPRLVNVVLDEIFLDDTGMKNWRVSLLVEGLVPGQVYHVQESIDGETFLGGLELTATAPESRISWGTLNVFDLEAYPRLLFRIESGPAPKLP